MTEEWDEADEAARRLLSAAREQATTNVKRVRKLELLDLGMFVASIGMIVAGILTQWLPLLGGAAGAGLLPMWREWRRSRRVRINYEKYAEEFS